MAVLDQIIIPDSILKLAVIRPAFAATTPPVRTAHLQLFDLLCIADPIPVQNNAKSRSDQCVTPLDLLGIQFDSWFQQFSARHPSCLGPLLLAGYALKS